MLELIFVKKENSISSLKLSNLLKISRSTHSNPRETTRQIQLIYMQISTYLPHLVVRDKILYAECVHLNF